jgi:hypothetical protein
VYKSRDLCFILFYSNFCRFIAITLKGCILKRDEHSELFSFINKAKNKKIFKNV